MASSGYAIFDTAIGRCGIAWKDKAVLATQLPESSDAELTEHLLRKSGVALPAPAPPFVDEAIALIQRQVAGENVDLTRIPLALEKLAPFKRRALELLRQVPAGTTTTYAELAAKAGSPKASRAVGQAMATNPWPIVVPCHRVLAKGGEGGFTAAGGVDTKRRLLAIERADASIQASLFNGVSIRFDTE